MPEQIVKPHDFWLETCGFDTHHRSSNHARLDTPWNAFTQDDGALVCTLWVDRIVEIFDPREGRNRRFAKFGGKSKEWKGVAIMHGEAARSNLEKAVALHKPIFGYEAEPKPDALLRGERSVKHFYIDRAHQLKGWIGLRLMDLEERLGIEDEFRRKNIADDADPNSPATLFELVETTAEVPGSRGPEDSSDSEGEEEEINQEVDGNLSSDEYARLALPMLVAHVLQQQDDVLVPITYLRLAEMLGRHNKHGAPWARGLGKVLGRVTTMIDKASMQWPERPPFLTTVVVLSAGPNAGLPDKGISGRWPGYEALSFADKQAKVNAEYRRIIQFGSHWNEILRLAGVLPVEPPSVPDSGRASTGGWGGGESEAHKALKRFILQHPELCGASNDWFAQEEYALRSGDELDVMFKSDGLWIGVEVKSRISDQLLSDYERGLYQVVKYRAVLKAQANIDHPRGPPEVRVFLALETRLPDMYRELASTLGIKCLEGLTPSK